jgi:DNA-binding transcriptional MerR regulator
MSGTNGEQRARGKAVAGVATIQQVSQLLGVHPSTIRSWERRYGILTASRTTGGHRRYTPGELETLRLMRDHVQAGLRAGEAAALVLAAAHTSAASMVRATVLAAQQLQPKAIIEQLDTAHRLIGLDRTVDEVLMPALREIGEQWIVADSRIAHEHLATDTVRSWLARLRHDGPPLPVPPALLACGPGDEHTLGLEALAALLERRGWDCRSLGGRTPIPALLGAIDTTQPGAVVLVSHVPSLRADAVLALQSVTQHVAAAAVDAAPGGAEPLLIFFAGNAFSSVRARQGVPGTYLGLSVSQAAVQMTRMISARPRTKSPNSVE